MSIGRILYLFIYYFYHYGYITLIFMFPLCVTKMVFLLCSGHLQKCHNSYHGFHLQIKETCNEWRKEKLLSLPGLL